jgi:endonuclease YncB( thermonuclease family)
MLTVKLCLVSASVAFALVSVRFVLPLEARNWPAPVPLNESFAGTARVLDGDTIHVGNTRVRLDGIDAPESAQTCKRATGEDWACGTESTHAMRHLAEGREVTCRNHGLDKYGRTLGTCFVEGRNINMELVKLGLAWAYVKYSTAYTTEEAEARRAKLGVWQGQAMPAWEFRKLAWTQGEAQVSEQHGPAGCAIKGNVTANGHIYHMPWGRWYAQVRIEGHGNKRWFCSETEAQQAGWRPAYQ